MSVIQSILNTEMSVIQSVKRLFTLFLTVVLSRGKQPKQ